MSARKIICCTFISLLFLLFGFIHPLAFAEQIPHIPPAPSGALQSSGVLADGDWLKSYGGEESEHGRDAEQTADGGFILVGTVSSAGSQKTILIKTAADGSQEWMQTYEKENFSESGQSVAQTSDNGYIIACSSSSWTEGATADILVRKTDANGLVEWEKVFDKGTREAPEVIKTTSDGGYIILAHSLITPMIDNSIYILKIDKDGNSQWSATYAKTLLEVGSEIVETADAGFVVVRISITLQEAGLIKFDKNGNLLWDKILGDANQFYESMDMAADGGFILAGYQWSDTENDILLLKTDSEGDEQWTKTFGSESVREYGPKVRRTNDDGYIIQFWISTLTSNYPLVLLKTDADGNENWQKEIAPEYDWKYPASLEVTSDGGYIIGGTLAGDAMLLKAFPPELSAITLLSPEDDSFQGAPAPTFQWSPNGGRQAAYAVDFGLSSRGPIYSTYNNLHMILAEPEWMPSQDLWNRVPRGSWIAWRVRALDLLGAPDQIITSEVRYFYRW